MERKDAEFLKKYRFGVGMSLDASLPSINDRLRPSVHGGGNFEKVISALEWFNGYAGLNVITTVTNVNAKNLSAVVKFLHTKRVPCVLLNPVRLTHKKTAAL